MQVNTLTTRIAAWFLVFSLIGLIVLYVFEFRFFSNTFDVEKLVWQSMLTGLIPGTAAGWHFSKSEADSVGKTRIWAFCLISCIAFAPLAGSLGNRLLSPAGIQMKQYQFIQEKGFAASRYGFIEGEKIPTEGYFIFIMKDGKVERLKSAKPQFTGVAENSFVEIPVKKGLFGYEYVQWD